MSKIIVSVLRQENENSEAYWQQFYYDGNLHIPVTTLLEKINHQEHILDIDGKETSPIQWSCSCQQGLCGSCSMVINNQPALGCQIFCHEIWTAAMKFVFNH